MLLTSEIDFPMMLIILIILILYGTRFGTLYLWGSMWDWGDDSWAYNWGWSNHHREPQPADEEIRAKYREPTPEVVTVSADDLIENPDPHMEQLLRESRVREATKYRDDMARIAEEMDDEEAQKRYAIYGARLSLIRKALQMDNLKMEAHRIRAWWSDEADVTSGSNREKQQVSSGYETTFPPVETEASKDMPPLWRRRTGKTGRKAVKPEIADTPDVLILKEPAGFEPSTVEIPAGFTPPPPGPVTLGEKSETVKPMETEETERPDIIEQEKIDPGDYTDMISL